MRRRAEAGVRVAVDTTGCQDHPRCCPAAHQVFRLGGAGSIVGLVEPAEAVQSAVEEAEQVCPMQASGVEG